MYFYFTIDNVFPSFTFTCTYVCMTHISTVINRHSRIRQFCLFIFTIQSSAQFPTLLLPNCLYVKPCFWILSLHIFDTCSFHLIYYTLLIFVHQAAGWIFKYCLTVTVHILSPLIQDFWWIRYSLISLLLGAQHSEQ